MLSDGSVPFSLFLGISGLGCIPVWSTTNILYSWACWNNLGRWGLHRVHIMYLVFLVPLGTRSGFHKCVTLFRVRKLSGVPSDPVRVFFAFVAVLHALRLKSEHRYHGGNFNI